VVYDKSGRGAEASNGRSLAHCGHDESQADEAGQ